MSQLGPHSPLPIPSDCIEVHVKGRQSRQKWTCLLNLEIGFARIKHTFRENSELNDPKESMTQRGFAKLTLSGINFYYPQESPVYNLYIDHLSPVLDVISTNGFCYGYLRFLCVPQSKNQSYLTITSRRDWRLKSDNFALIEIDITR